MFAKLGDVKFDILPYINDMDETISSNYAEHKTIKGKPVLQYLGEQLDEINISIKLHAAYSNPVAEKEKLKTAMLKHMSLPFVYGNGDYRGDFVISEMRQAAIQNDNTGNIIALNIDLKLKEYASAQALSEEKNTKKSAAKKKTAKSSASGIRKKPASPAKTTLKVIRANVNQKSTVSIGKAISRKEWLDNSFKQESVRKI